MMTCSKALSLFKACFNFEFITALVITRSILSYTAPVTKLLQKESSDIIHAYELVQSMQSHFHDIRSNIDTFHNEWYSNVTKLAEKVQLQESVPHSCNRQIFRDNQPYKNLSDYFKCSITIPLVDHVLTQLNSQFSDDNVVVVNGFYLVPYILYKANSESVF